MKKRSSAEIVGDSVKRDSKLYIGEYLAPFALLSSNKPNALEQEGLSELLSSIERNDVVVCSGSAWASCAEAVTVLQKRGVQFTSVAVTDASAQKALKSALKKPFLIFPLVFVRGAYLGGVDRLLHATAGDGRGLDTLMAAPRQVFPARAPDPLRILVGPRGQPWYHFQLHVYSTYVRVISVLHVIIGALCGAFASSAPMVSKVLLVATALDLVVVILLGPTPLAPLSAAVSCLVWPIRGNAVSSLIYKCIFAFYVFSIAGILLASDSDSSASLSLYGTLVFNSGLLAVFRLWLGCLIAGSIIKPCQYMLRAMRKLPTAECKDQADGTVVGQSTQSTQLPADSQPASGA